MSAKTPAEACREGYWGDQINLSGAKWDELDPDSRADWEEAAKRARADLVAEVDRLSALLRAEQNTAKEHRDAAGKLAKQLTDATAEVMRLKGARRVNAHFFGNGPYPLQLVCLTEDASDVECDQAITEVEPGVTWDELEALIAKHGAEHHGDAVGKPVAAVRGDEARAEIERLKTELAAARAETLRHGNRLLVREAELAATELERGAARNSVCKLLDLFGAADARRMRQAHVTVATLERYAREAGVRS